MPAPAHPPLRCLARAALLGAFAAITLGPALAQERVYRVALDRENEPYEFLDEHGQAQGYTPVLLRAIGEAAGVRFEFVPLTWTEVIAALDSGAVDLISTIKVPERTAHYEFTAPHSRFAHAIFRHRNARGVVGLASLGAHALGLQQPEIALLRQAGAQEVNAHIARSKLEGLLRLNLGQLDAFFCAEQAGVRLVSQYQLANVELAAGELFPQDFAFASRRGNRALVELLDEQLARLRASGELKTLHDRWLSGRLRSPNWVERNAFILLALGGGLAATLLLVLAWNRTLSRRALAVSAVHRQSQAEHRAMLDSAMDGFWRVDTEGRLVEVNATYCRMSGYGVQELLTLHVADLEAVEAADEVADHIRKVTAQGEDRFESRHRRKDGSVFEVEISVQYRPAAGGQFVVFVRDITERKRAEAALRLSEARFRSLTQLSSDWYWEQDEQFRFVRMDGELEVNTGIKAADHIGRTRWDMPALNMTPADWEAHQALLLAHRPFYDLEMRRPDRDGRMHWVSISGMPILDEQGRCTGYRGVGKDITERKLAEAATQSSLLEKVALLKEVHHRVKNNLQVVTSLLRLEGRRSKAPEAKAVLADMQGRVHLMAMMHEALYRSDRFSAVDLGDYLSQIVSQAFRTLAAPSAGVRLALDLPSVQVGMDQATPCGLLVNELISNSLKHGFPDGRSGEVRVELQVLDDTGLLRLRVSDTGVGLPADFELRRSRSLGLQLASDLAGQLGGTMEIGPGPAAAFAITFRADPAKPPAPPAPPAPSVPPAPPAPAA